MHQPDWVESDMSGQFVLKYLIVINDWVNTFTDDLSGWFVVIK